MLGPFFFVAVSIQASAEPAIHPTSSPPFAGLENSYNESISTYLMTAMYWQHKQAILGHSKADWQLSGEQEEGDGGLALEESKPELKRPPLFKVVLINDDYTPMEFVVDVLQMFFRMNLEQATHVMLTVHTQGKGVCGIFTRDIAETKAAQVNQYARENEHPLLCEIEASEG